MARELAAIKINVGLRQNGHHDYPDFNRLASVVAAGMDWSYYVDAHGIGWHYDKVSGHKEEEPGSPYGMQWSVLIVPEQFALEAIAEFPTLITRMTEVECEAFYNDRAHAHEDETLRDDALLASLDFEQRHLDARVRENPQDQAAKDSQAALRAKTARAYDLDDPQPGRKKNHNRRWVDVKARRGITFKEQA